MFYFISMLIIRTDQPNTMVVTVSQNSELTNPEYLFSFVHIFSKERVSFIPTDISTHKSRYDEFYFVEGTGAGQVNFPYSGLYLYSISEQPSGSGNLDPALATNVVENGEAQIIVSTAITTDSQFDIFISNNEDNSNIIFAPDEPNPTPNVTPSPTSTPNQPTPTPTPSITPTQTATNTPTPSITPTFTPTPSTTPAVLTPANLGALWWVDYTNPANLTFDSPTQIASAKDLISNTYIWSASTASGPIYNPTGYLSLSGTASPTGNGLSNALGVFPNTYSAYTTFMNISLLPTHQGGNLIMSDNAVNYTGGTTGYRWFSVDSYVSGQDNVRTYTFYDNGNSVNPEPRTEDLTEGDFNFIATRVYMSGGEPYVEIWLNGVKDDDTTNSGQVLFSATNPIFQLLNGGGLSSTAEHFFFGRALSDAEMTQMFFYLQTKYPLQ